MIAKGGEEWSVEGGMNIRTVTKVSALLDVGPVTFPAYPDATVSVARRSLEVFKKGLEETIQKEDEQKAEAMARRKEYEERFGELRSFLRERENR